MAHLIADRCLMLLQIVLWTMGTLLFIMITLPTLIVFGSILNNMKLQFPNAHDYSAEMYLREAKSGGGGHPLINGVLGKWIDHMKGGRKDSGKSLKKDIMVNRTEAYWNEI